MDFKKFDNLITKEQLADIAAAEANQRQYEDTPKGRYNVRIEKMELGATGANSAGGAGRPMLKVMARVIDGEYEKRCLFMNRVMYGTKNDANMIASAVGFLKSLDPTATDIVFETYSQFAELVLDIQEDFSGAHFTVDYDPDAFNSISVVNLDDTDVPF